MIDCAVSCCSEPVSLEDYLGHDSED
jgi:hypothetical protein